MATGNHIGLIGGLATKAGIFYYEQLQARHAAAGASLDLTLRHADVATVLEHVGAGDETSLGNYLGALANELFDAGADVVAVSAVAPHMAIRQIAEAATGHVINVLEIVPEALNRAGFERVAVFGNRAVMETDIFGAVDTDVVVRLDAEVVNSVHEAYTEIALVGKRGTPREVEFFEGAARAARAKGADAIVLAGTDLSSFYAESPPAFPHIDLAEIHIQQIMSGG